MALHGTAWHCMVLHGTACAAPAWATHGMHTQLACMCPKFWQHLAGTYYTHMPCHTSPLHTCVPCGAPPRPMFQPPQTPNLGPEYLHACNPHQGISEYVWQGISQGVRGWSYMFEKLNKKVCSNGVKSTSHANLHASTHVHATQLQHPYLPGAFAYQFVDSSSPLPCFWGCFPRACEQDSCTPCCCMCA